MAWVNPSTRAVGAVVTASMWNSDVVANTEFLAKPPSVTVTKTTEQSIAVGSWRSIAWSAESWDTNSMWSSTAATRVDINTAGKYLITASVNWSTGGTGDRRQMGIYAGTAGSTSVAPNIAQAKAHNPGGASNNPSNHVSAIVSLTSTEVVRVQVSHNSTAATTVRHSTAGGEVPRLSVMWMSS